MTLDIGVKKVYDRDMTNTQTLHWHEEHDTRFVATDDEGAIRGSITSHAVPGGPTLWTARKNGGHEIGSHADRAIARRMVEAYA